MAMFSTYTLINRRERYYYDSEKLRFREIKVVAPGHIAAKI